MRTFRLSTVNSNKVQSQSNLLCLIMSSLLSPHQIKSLINQSKSQLILVRVNTFNQSKVSIIGKNSFNHMKVFK